MTAETIHSAIEAAIWDNTRQDQLTDAFQTEIHNEITEFFSEIPSISTPFSPSLALRNFKLDRHLVNLADQLAEFAVIKENIRRQRLAIGKCTELLQRTIEHNNEVDSATLISIITKFANRYGFDSLQKQLFQETIREYYLARYQLKELMINYPDSKKLANYITGKDTSTLTSCIATLGPISIDFEVDEVGAKLLWPGELPKNLSTDPLIGYMAIGNNDIPYTVKNSTLIGIRYPHIDPQTVLIHEHEHSKNDLLNELFFSEKVPHKLSEQYYRSPSKNVKLKYLEEFFLKHQKHALIQAKDEILACLKERNIEKLQQSARAMFQRDGKYDFVSEIGFEEAANDEEDFKRVKERILERDYLQIIMHALDSFYKLIAHHQYSHEMDIALLVDVPLVEWPSMERLLRD